MTGLSNDIAALIESGDSNPERFNQLALAIFEYQYQSIPVVKTLADNAGITPGAISDWELIPAVPTVAFKQADLFAGNASQAECVFESSGTSGAAKSRSLFSRQGLDLMELSIRANAGQMLLTEGRSTRILVLAPPPKAAPHMIMAWGMERLIHHFGLEGSRFLIGPDGLDPKEVVGELQRAAADQIPITLIGASFGFVHLLDGLAANGIRIECAPGSRSMDAGGFKGRSRVLTRHDLDDAIARCLGIDASRNVNLLGMTELASQFYDNVLRDNGAEHRAKVNAPWTRTRVLNPTTLEVSPAGVQGILCHLDMANLERPLVIRTDDLGVATPDGWQVLGRAEGAESRGCSLTVEEMLK
jgi:hypothetical protein